VKKAKLRGSTALLEFRQGTAWPEFRQDTARPQRWRRESDKQLAQHLRALGCSETQVLHHLERRVPITLPAPRISIYAPWTPRYR
jgi:hypothetical protein